MLTIFRQFKGTQLKLNKQSPEYIQMVLKTAMALKQIDGTGMFSQCEISSSEGNEEFGEHVEEALDVMLAYDIDDIGDLEIYYTSSDANEIEEPRLEEGFSPCSGCQSKIEESQKEKAEFENEFKLHTAEAVLTIFEHMDITNESIDSLKRENALIKEAMTLIVQAIEEME